MILWALIGIFVLFVVFSFLRETIHRISGIKICSICSAVSLTWITLLALKIGGMEISPILIGILMGESITGIMYLFERKAKKSGKNRILWLKSVIIILGTLLVYLLLTQGFSQGLVIAAIISIVIAVFVYESIKNNGGKKANNKKYGKFRKEIAKLEDKFEHCCD